MPRAKARGRSHVIERAANRIIAHRPDGVDVVSRSPPTFKTADHEWVILDEHVLTVHEWMTDAGVFDDPQADYHFRERNKTEWIVACCRMAVWI